MTNNNEKKYTFELTEWQIAIIKAGLQLYWIADEYGYALWGTVPGATFGSTDRLWRNRVSYVYEMLNQKSKVEPDYGWWVNLEKINEICIADFKVSEKLGKEEEKRLNEELLKDI